MFDLKAPSRINTSKALVKIINRQFADPCQRLPGYSKHKLECKICTSQKAFTSYKAPQLLQSADIHEPRYIEQYEVKVAIIETFVHSGPVARNAIASFGVESFSVLLNLFMIVNMHVIVACLCAFSCHCYASSLSTSLDHYCHSYQCRPESAANCP